MAAEDLNKNGLNEVAAEQKVTSVFPVNQDGSDVERTLNDIRREKEGEQKKKRSKKDIFLLIIGIIFFPVTGVVLLARKINRKINLPLTAKMTLIYSIIFFIVLTAFVIFFIKSLNNAGGSSDRYIRLLSVTSAILVLVVSALYAAMVWVTGQLMLKPIRSITERIDDVTGENLSARLDQVDSQDELMELTNRINEMLDNLEDSFNRRQNFVADASHELKTPIAVIKGYSEMLGRWGKDDPKILNEGIEAIERESDNMKKIVEQLLLLTRLGNFSLNVASFNLVEVVNEIADSYKMMDTKHTVEFVCHEDNITVSTDKNLLIESIRAITDNAIKYTPEGGKITVSCIMVDDHAEISVADTGIGISQEDLPHIFERFYRCDKAHGREKGSSGLGLSIAQSIVKTMGGDITVESTPGIGSTFVIKLY